MPQEDPEQVSALTDIANEMLGDGLSVSDLQATLSEMAPEFGVSEATVDQILRDLNKNTQKRASLALELDKSAILGFVVGRICQLRLQVTNDGDKGLKSIQLRWASTACSGVAEDHSRAVGPGGDTILTASIQPETPGQHGFEGVLTATDYRKNASHFTFRAVGFEVVERTEGPHSLTIQTSHHTEFSGDNALRGTMIKDGVNIGGGDSGGVQLPKQAAGRLRTAEAAFPRQELGRLQIAWWLVHRRSASKVDHC